MEFESKILSKNISELLYNSEKTLGTAESCTGGDRKSTRLNSSH